MEKEMSPGNRTEAWEKLLISIRSTLQKVRAFFRGFTEEDACALLSGYGFHALEVDRLQGDAPSTPKEVSGNLRSLTYGKWIGQVPGPIPLGVHPDLTRARWTCASDKQVPR
jgi:hypothetical protein